MYEVNRAALVVRPKQPYIDWANQLEVEGLKLDPTDLAWEPTLYLIEQIEDEADAQAALQKHFATIFEQELLAWHLKESDWPRKRDFQTFSEWFEVEAHSLVIDLGDTKLKAAEFSI